MTAAAVLARPRRSGQFWGGLLHRNSILIVLLLLILFAGLRYDRFLTEFNIMSVLRYNSMFGLIGLGMAFVIMTGGIDLSVGAVAALGSVVAALASPYGMAAAVAAPCAAGLAFGLLNGAIVARLRLAPFIVTLATMLAARGIALWAADRRSVPVSGAEVMQFGMNALFSIPYSVYVMAIAFAIGTIVLNFTGFGRATLAIGGNEEAARLMGLPVGRVLVGVYAMSGFLSGLAGFLLAAQFGAGQPAEGVGWELLAIAAVVVGGTLLTGGVGSAIATLYGVLLLGLIFNILNFENGRGWINLSVYWQSVIRGVFLLVVVVLQSRLRVRRRRSQA